MLFSNLILACHLLVSFAQGPVVSEFLADNSGSLLDEDGDSSGMSKISVTLPAALSGVQVWLQAVDLSAGVLSNGAERIVQ